MMDFDSWWNSAAADEFRAKHEDMDGNVVRPVWDAAMLAAAPSPDGKAERMDGVRAFIRADAELARGGKAEQAEAPMNETLKTMIADMNGEIEG